MSGSGLGIHTSRTTPSDGTPTSSVGASGGVVSIGVAVATAEASLRATLPRDVRSERTA